MGLFGAVQEWGRQKGIPFLKICYSYPTMMEFGAVILYLDEDQKSV